MDYLKGDIIYSWKPLGISPVEHISQLRKEKGISSECKICFAGRLDPMASGMMIYLTGNKTKEVQSYLKFKKTYDFNIVFGIRTDSLDCLGRIIDFDIEKVTTELIDNLKSKIENNEFIEYTQVLPIYSSQPVKSNKNSESRPLWEWARLNRINEVDIPIKNIKLYSLETLNITEIKLIDYIDRIIEDIRKVRCFPKEQCKSAIDDWNNLKKNINSDKKIIIMRCRATVPSGTYIRQLSQVMGDSIGLYCHAQDITRIKLFP